MNGAHFHLAEAGVTSKEVLWLPPAEEAIPIPLKLMIWVLG